jgi:hypothetical protein
MDQGAQGQETVACGSVLSLPCKAIKRVHNSRDSIFEGTRLLMGKMDDCRSLVDPQGLMQFPLHCQMYVRPEMLSIVHQRLVRSTGCYPFSNTIFYDKYIPL